MLSKRSAGFRIFGAFSECGDVELLADFLYERFLCQSVEIFYHSVIVEYVKLFTRKQNGKKIVELLAAVEIRMFLPPLHTDAHSRRGSVMTVRYIESRHGMK